ncbi:DUF1707 domain-containing protein [Kribbella sp. NPDC051952]|uniref:DUF1707 SHOCT-like domain-containing protein n=1 Tax=Kribbella sp. NPDC051952 TaxID=3154851 RepID=UPI003422DE90
MTTPPEDRSPMVGDLDRDTAVQRVQDAFTSGHISHEDMDARLHQVLSATRRSELEVALDALPAEDPGTSSTIGAATGRIQRRGRWVVPRTLKVESAFGRVHLDLSQAVFEHPVHDIVLNLGTGRAKLTLPADAIVDLEGLKTGWKDLRYKPNRRSTGSGGVRIRLTGAMGFGRLKIRHARR